MSSIQAAKCGACRDGAGIDFALTMAFQPIVDMETGRAYAYEALVRGPEGQGALTVLSQVTDANRYAFDQQCRVTAIHTAVAAGLLADGARLSINFLPNAVYSPQACIKLTLAAAAATGLPPERLMFEFTENEEMVDPAHVARIVETYRAIGFTTAIDDFGAGYAGLSLLSRFQPDCVKLDMAITRGIDAAPRQRAIVRAVRAMCDEMGITLIAEGIETADEARALADIGIRYMQGYLFARPALRELPPIILPTLHLN